MALTPTLIDKQFQQIWGFDPRTIPTCNLWLDTSTGSIIDLSIYGNKVVQSGNVTYSTSPNGLKYAILSDTNYLTMGSASATIVDSVFKIGNIQNTYNSTGITYRTFISIASTQTLPLPSPIAVNALVGTGGMSYYSAYGVLPAYTVSILPTANTSWTVGTNISSSTISYTYTLGNFIVQGAYVFFSAASSTTAAVSLTTVMIDTTLATYSCDATNPYLIGMYITISGYSDEDNNGRFPISDFIYNPTPRFDLTITDYTSANPCVFTYSGGASNISNGTQIFLNNTCGSIIPGIYYVTKSSGNTLQITSSQCGNSNIKTGIENTSAGGSGGTMTIYTKILGIRVPILNQSSQVANTTTSITRVITYTYSSTTYTKYIFNLDPTSLGYARDGMSISTSLLSTTNNVISTVDVPQTIVDINPKTIIRLTKAEYLTANTITYTAAESLPDYYTNNSYVTISSFNNINYNVSNQPITKINVTQFTVTVVSNPGLAPQTGGTATLQNIHIIKLSSASFILGNTFTTYTSTYALPSSFTNNNNLYVSITLFTDPDYNVTNAKVTVVDANNFTLNVIPTELTGGGDLAIATIVDPYYITIARTGANMPTQIPLRIVQHNSTYLDHYYGAVCTSATWSPGFFRYTFNTDITIFGYATGNLITIAGFTPSSYNVSTPTACTISSSGTKLTIPTTTATDPGIISTKGHLVWSLPSGGYEQKVNIYGYSNSYNNYITAGGVTVTYYATYIRRNYVTSAASETPTSICWATVPLGNVVQFSTDVGTSKDTGIEVGQGYVVDSVSNGGSSGTFTLLSPVDPTLPYTMNPQTFAAGTVASSTYLVAQSTSIANTTRIVSNTIYVDNIDWIWRGKVSVWFETRPPTGTYPGLGSKYYVIYVNPAITSSNDYAIQVSSTAGGTASTFTSGTYTSKLYLSDIVATYAAANGSMGMIQTSPNIVKITTPTSLDTTLSNMATISGIRAYGAIYGSLITGMVQGTGSNAKYVTVTLTSNIPSTYIASTVVTIAGIEGINLSGYNGSFVISSPSGKTFKIISTITGTSPIYTNSTNSIQPNTTIWAVPTGYNGTYKILSQSVSLPTPLTSYYGFNIASTLNGSAIYTYAKVNVGLDIAKNSFAIFAAVKLPTLPVTGTTTSYIISKNSSASPYWKFYAVSDTAKTTIYISCYVTSLVESSVSTTDSGWVIVSAIVDRSNGLCAYVNGKPGTNVTTLPSNTLTSTATTYVGRDPTTVGNSWSSGIGEILMYNSSIDTSKQQTIEGYLAWKWGLQNSLIITHNYYGLKPSPLGTNPTSPFSQLLAPTDIPNCKIWLDGRDKQTIYFNPNNALLNSYLISLVSNTLTAYIYINLAQYNTLIELGVHIGNTVMVLSSGLTDADGYKFKITSIDVDTSNTYKLTCTRTTLNNITAEANAAGNVLLCYGEFPNSTNVNGWYDKAGQGNSAYPYSGALVPTYSPNYGVVFKLANRSTANIKLISNATALESAFSAKNRYETGFIVFNADYFSQNVTATYGGTGGTLGYFTFLLSSAQYLTSIANTFKLVTGTAAYSRTLILYNHSGGAYADSTASGIFTLRSWGNPSAGRVSTTSLNSLNSGSGELHAGKTYILTYTTVYDSTKPSPYVNGIGCPSIDNGTTFPVSAGTSEIRTLIGPQFQGKILEYIAYTSDTSSIISDEDQRRVEGYLAKKWGVTLVSGHPFATIPADDSVPY